MVLIDTTPLVALCDPRDSLNAAASKHLRTIAPAGLGVCDPVLTEACFHLPAPSQRRRLGALLDALHIRTVDTDAAKSFRRDVFAWLDRYSEHEPDLADAYLAVLCGHQREFKVWTYDSQFRTIWRRPDGSAIPLAVRV